MEKPFLMIMEQGPDIRFHSVCNWIDCTNGRKQFLNFIAVNKYIFKIVNKETINKTCEFYSKKKIEWMHI